ncbi:hypothetical protein FKW77_003239 [Venturia effusa]|uniref:Uncharacterized protein n=1 Tax=Venturia effusa TaxID=50376 RepID=A0A517LQX2_9PEZI|nr:hypothetical protein FKW77_003239 [Venturia effusa]
MSLLVTPTLFALHQLANEKGAQEHHAETFWSHYFSKQIFVSEEWITAHQKPPSDENKHSRRRVDFNICYVNPLTKRLKIVTVVEGKGAHTTERDLEIVEAQAQEACEASGHGPVWAVTFQGTKARIFKWTQPRWTAMTTHYIEASSPDASRLYRYFCNMRDSAQPAAQPATGYAAQPATATQTPAYGQTAQPAATSTTQDWKWDAGRGGYYYWNSTEDCYIYQDNSRFARDGTMLAPAS